MLEQAAMPVTYRIDPNEKIVYLSIVGESSFGEWREAMLAVLTDSFYRPGFDFLTDRRAAPAPTSDFIRGVVAFIREHHGELGGGRRAVVVGSMADFGMGRMAETLGEDLPSPIRVFKDVDEARRWLLAGRR